MRRLFTEKLIQWKHAKPRKPLLVRGLRQVGKTYSLQEFGKQYFRNLHYVNFERDGRLSEIFVADLNPRRILQELSFILNTTIDVTQDFILFDEIQACPRALNSLKYFQEELPQLALSSAGSLLGVYLSSEPFPVGKVDMLKVYPMSFIEFLLGIGDDRSVDFINQLNNNSKIPEIVHAHLWRQMKLYFIVGGLPEVVHIFRDNRDNLPAAFELVRKKQEELILAYNADMAKHAGKVNSMHLDRVLKAVPSQLARAQDDSAAKFKFKGIVAGINRYSRLAGVIDWLEAAGLIIKSYSVNCGELPFAAYTKENTFKLYLADVGLLGAMSGLSPVTIFNYDYGTYKGYFAENFVAQEFCSSGVGHLYGWQEGHAEVEFLLDINGKAIPIEVKSGRVTRAKSLQIFADKYQPPYRVILSGNNMHIDMAHKFQQYPLYLAGKFSLDPERLLG
jgi:uncharacterized protein